MTKEEIRDLLLEVWDMAQLRHPADRVRAYNVAVDRAIDELHRAMRPESGEIDTLRAEAEELRIWHAKQAAAIQHYQSDNEMLERQRNESNAEAARLSEHATLLEQQRDAANRRIVKLEAQIREGREFRRKVELRVMADAVDLGLITIDDI